MGNTKETGELLIIPAKLFDSIKASLANGQFKLGEDFTNFLDDLAAIEPGINGVSLIKEEAATQSNDDRSQLQQLLAANMPNVEGNQKDLIARGIMGIYSFYHLIFAYGFEAGQKHIESGQERIQVL